MKKYKICLVFFISATFTLLAQNSFTEKDRQTLLELSVKMSYLEQRQLELREDMNKRFEQVDKRFEQVGRGIDRVYTVLAILCGIFTTLIAGMFWFLYTERKTQSEAIKQLNEKISFLETSQILLLKLIATFKELATKDEKIREAMLHNNLI